MFLSFIWAKAEQNLLTKSDYNRINWGKNPEKIEFSKIYENRFNVLKIAYNNFDLTKKEYIEFCNIFLLII